MKVSKGQQRPPDLTRSIFCLGYNRLSHSTHTQLQPHNLFRQSYDNTHSSINTAIYLGVYEFEGCHLLYENDNDIT